MPALTTRPIFSDQSNGNIFPWNSNPTPNTEGVFQGSTDQKKQGEKEKYEKKGGAVSTKAILFTNVPGP